MSSSSFARGLQAGCRISLAVDLHWEACAFLPLPLLPSAAASVIKKVSDFEVR